MTESQRHTDRETIEYKTGSEMDRDDEKEIDDVKRNRKIEMRKKVSFLFSNFSRI